MLSAQSLRTICHYWLMSDHHMYHVWTSNHDAVYGQASISQTQAIKRKYITLPPPKKVRNKYKHLVELSLSFCILQHLASHTVPYQCIKIDIWMSGLNWTLCLFFRRTTSTCVNWSKRKVDNTLRCYVENQTRLSSSLHRILNMTQKC